MTETVSPLKNLNTSEGGDQDVSAKASPGKQPGSPILKSRQGGSDVSGKSTFLTGTNLGKKGYDDKPQKLDEVYNYHDKLNGFIEQLGSTVRTLLSDNQANFLVAYKEQMIIIQKELNQLRKKIDEETYKRKNDERMNILEQERDWFRAEAIRLDKICKEQQKVIQELKFKMKMLNDDKNYFEDFVLSAKKENKALKEELMQFELGRKSGDDFAQGLSKSLPTSHKKGQRDSAQKRDNSPVQAFDFDGNQATTEALRNEYASLKESLNQQMTYTGDEKLLEVIKQMKIELDREKKLTRQLRNEKSQIIVRRIELEQILVESINEVKKEISRRRNAKGYKDFNKGPQVPQDIDISKFSATDKRNVLEYFLSNEMVLEEVYNMVFNSPHAVHAPINADPLDPKPHNPGLSTLASTKSEGKMKYSFNYGFGNASNIRLGPKELNNVAFSQKAQNLIGELKRPDMKRVESVRREL